MEVYKSTHSSEAFNYALGAVPSIGENGNWWIGEQDTGIFAKGINVTGAEVGQTVKIAAVDENGVPTAWEAANLSSWKTLVSLTVEEEADYFELTTDVDGNAFNFSDVSEVILYINATGTCSGGYYPNFELGNAVIGSPVQFTTGDDIINIASMHAVYLNGVWRIEKIGTAGTNWTNFSVSGDVRVLEWNRVPIIKLSNTVLLPGAVISVFAR